MAMACRTNAPAEMHRTSITFARPPPQQQHKLSATAHRKPLHACSVMRCASLQCHQQTRKCNASCCALPASLPALSQHRTQKKAQNWVTCATGPLNAACNVHGNRLTSAKQRQNDSKYVWAGYRAGVGLTNTHCMPKSWAQHALHAAQTSACFHILRPLMDPSRALQKKIGAQNHFWQCAHLQPSPQWQPDSQAHLVGEPVESGGGVGGSSSRQNRVYSVKERCENGVSQASMTIST